MLNIKRLKAYLSFSLCLILLLFVFTGCSKTEDSIIANPSTDFEYRIDESKSELIISRYIGTSTNVIIPEKIEDFTVKWVGARAFMNTNIESVTIPKCVDKICINAFTNCQSLQTVRIKSTSLIIDDSAFEGCKSLTDINLPHGLTELGVKAFNGCKSLKKITIPKTVEKWGMETFFECPLEELVLKDGIKTLGAYASFWGATFDEITIPKSLEQIGEYVFHDNLEKVVFEGDAPNECGKQPFGKKTVIYCKKGTVGWDNPVFEKYTFVEE